MAQEIITGCPSTMNDEYQLNTTTLIRHAARTYGEQEIVYRAPDGGWTRYTYADAFKRIAKQAHALAKLGVGPGDRVGVLDWNSQRFFELYYSIPGLGAVMLQMNLRLGVEDLGYVGEHSETKYVCVDESLLPVAESIADVCPSIQGWIVMTDKPMSEISTTLKNTHHFEDLIADEPDTYDWPMIDETSAYSACYTTGTTGKPKGVYYSHRAIYLHAMGMVGNLGMNPHDCTMLITPMFHGNCWGLPQAATLAATKLVLPGRYTADDTGLLTDAMIAEGVTVANGAPAIFGPMLQHIRQLDEAPDLSQARFISGATEPPLSMMRGFKELTGADFIHAYGATETTPMVTLNRGTKPSLMDADEETKWDLKRKQGLPLTSIDFRIVSPDLEDLPWDGETVGEVLVRGPWITRAYHGMEDSIDRFVDGYWRSGDVGAIDKNGYLKVSDRLKDVIKSGGEWISSIDMENLLVAHPKIRDAAVVGIPHPKFQERPLAIVALMPGEEMTLEEVHEQLLSHFAKWQLPDRVEFVDEVPKTSVGKADKKRMRATHETIYGGPEA